MNSGQRLASLDAFRGFAIAGMVLVNNPGDWNALYPQLAHAAWHGWTFTDWIFPFFLFIVGVSMTISLGRRAAAGDSRGTLWLVTARRAALIFAIGLLLNLVPRFDFATVRIPGVLQRIGLCVLLAAPIVLYCRWRGVLAWLVGSCALYGVLMLAVPVPDAQGVVAAGALEPGRDFGAWLDRLLLGGHLWAASRTWDPEGLVSTLPAVGTLLSGVLAGRFLAQPRPAAEQTVWLLLAGLALLWLGAMLDAVFMPINKSLWTPSYMVFMDGWALLVFGAFHWLLDAAPQPGLRAAAARWFKPLQIYGMNALLIFAVSGLVAKLMLFFKFGEPPQSVKQWLYAPIQALPLAPRDASLLWALLFNGAMFALAWWLWRRRWFFKV
ncbi:MAG: heparan-alpha-glucosaminide N-acetyltransferase domain-containing protein [Rubrivivax sp.]